MKCPHGCGTELAGLALFCWKCQRYVDEDVKAPPGSPKATKSPAERILDTRPESKIRLAIRRVLDVRGWTVIDFEQGYRRDGSTRVMKGLPDLLIMGRGVFEWVEVKSAGGIQRPEQVEFELICQECGIPYRIWHHESEAVAWCDEKEGGRNAESEGVG